VKKVIAVIGAGILLIFSLFLPVFILAEVAHQPFKFIGDHIRSKGNVYSVDEEFIELYGAFLSSEFGYEMLMYIVQKENELTLQYDYENEQRELRNAEREAGEREGSQERLIEYRQLNREYILLCIILVVDSDSFDSDLTFHQTELPRYCDIAVERYMNSANNTAFLRTIKNHALFQKVNDITDSTFNVYTNAMSLNNGTIIAGVGSPIDVDTFIYQNASNPFIPTYRGQCTWFAWSRVMEVSGVTMPTGNANTWYDNTELPRGLTPRSGAVGVFGNGEYGHVIYIESYDEVTNIIIFSESNYSNPFVNGGGDQVEYARDNYRSLVQVTQMDYNTYLIQRTQRMSLIGYIYTY